LLVKALVEDPDARVQWIFANRNVKATLVQWARARGESGDTIVRAMDVMAEPHPGGPHDDHVHVRTACSPAEVVAGCEHTGPRRPWVEALDRTSPIPSPAESRGTAPLDAEVADDRELIDAILRPLDSSRDKSIADSHPPPSSPNDKTHSHAADGRRPPHSTSS